jgi:hypothetical protein
MCECEETHLETRLDNPPLLLSLCLCPSSPSSHSRLLALSGSSPGWKKGRTQAISNSQTTNQTKGKPGACNDGNRRTAVRGFSFFALEPGPAPKRACKEGSLESSFMVLILRLDVEVGAEEEDEPATLDDMSFCFFFWGELVNLCGCVAGICWL